MYALLPVIGLIFLGANFVSANGFGWFHHNISAEDKQAAFERKADILGISVEELKQKWEDKKHFVNDGDFTKENWQAKKSSARTRTYRKGYYHPRTN